MWGNIAVISIIIIIVLYFYGVYLQQQQENNTSNGKNEKNKKPWKETVDLIIKQAKKLKKANPGDRKVLNNMANEGMKNMHHYKNKTIPQLNFKNPKKIQGFLNRSFLFPNFASCCYFVVNPGGVTYKQCLDRTHSTKKLSDKARQMLKKMCDGPNGFYRLIKDLHNDHMNVKSKTMLIQMVDYQLKKLREFKKN